MEPGLTELEQIWSLLLLSCSLLLNLVALVVLVRWAGSCHSDPAVPPLISVTGQPHLTHHTSHLTWSAGRGRCGAAGAPG